MRTTGIVLAIIGSFLASIAYAQDDIATLRLTQACDGCDFSEQSFPFGTFSSYEFFCTDFGGANLEQSNFSDARFHGTFMNANMRGANLTNIQVSSVRWANCEIKYYLSSNESVGTFTNVDLRGAILENAQFEDRTDFARAKLDGAVFAGAEQASGPIYMEGVSARGTNFQSFRGWMQASNANFERSNFENYNGAIETNAGNFAGVVFDGAYLIQSSFTNVNLTGTSFRNANLRDVDFTGSNLTDANLEGADLRGANFSGAILCNTTAPDGAVLFTTCD